MSKQRIINYVMNTPGNTNPNVLNSLLDEEMNDLPPIGPEDKNKYLHTNESTGDLEWAEGGSGGGVLVVHAVAGSGSDATLVLDKTWQEIHDADYPVIDTGGPFSKLFVLVNAVYEDDGVYYVNDYTANTANDYPSKASPK